MRDSFSSSFSQWIGTASDMTGNHHSGGSGSMSSSMDALGGGGGGGSGNTGEFAVKNNARARTSQTTRSRSRLAGWRNRLTNPQKAMWGPTHSSSSDSGEDGGDKDTEELADTSHLLDQPNTLSSDNDDACDDKMKLNRMTTPPQTPLSKADDAAGQSTPSTKSSKEEDDDEDHDHDQPHNTNTQNVNSSSNRNGSDNTSGNSFRRDSMATTMQITLGKVWNNLQCMEDTTLWGSDEVKQQSSSNNYAVTQTRNVRSQDMEEVCPSPCSPTNVNDVMALHEDDDENDNVSPLGISRLLPPGAYANLFGSKNKSRKNSNGSGGVGDDDDAKSTATIGSAMDRRKERHKRRQERNAKAAGALVGKSCDDFSAPQEAYEVTPDQIMVVQTEPPKKRKGGGNNKVNGAINTLASFAKPLPMESLTLNTQKVVELERTISELTMRSSYGEATAKIAESRRMAYYAVGRHHRQSGRGGNRRCYFTGKLILGGAPFFAGSVQQGLRTLVVFCLPSAIGLPRDQKTEKTSSFGLSGLVGGGSSHSRRPSLNSRGDAPSVTPSVAHSVKTKSSLLSRKGSRLSRLSSVDDASMSVEEELDPNWELDRDYLLNVLPEPDQNLLDEMARRYPQQFETLPVQVRSPHCWKLYVKFCFFSGLPIAEGELHYKVRDAVANQCGEEVILSHEVMVAVNGDSATILRLPNQKTFRYLKRHYNQQSAKLDERYFERQSWEMVRCEV
mmetsp:Transcript_34474/g.83164  ORF Transcript_34474/g.83164 Transcript_34474/m.83164 type:complete len:729 (+) Transcript_34474:664-2850(+)